jgi:hypothetical protein
MKNILQKRSFSAWIAEVISLLLHPVFIPLYTVVLYFYLSPRYFLPQNIYSLFSYLLIVSIIIPLLFLLMLRLIRIVESIKLKTARERLFFSVIMTSVYFIIFNKLIDYHDYIELYSFFFGIFLSLAMLAVFNYQKIKPSIHAVAVSGMLTFFIMWSYYSRVNILNVLSAFIMLGAFAIAARLYLQAHSFREIVMGLMIGVLMQVIAFYYILEFF